MWDTITSFSSADVRFAYPWVLLLLLVLPLLYYVMQRRPEVQSGLRLSSLRGFQARPTWRTRLRKFLPIFRLIALLFLVVALARPQELNTQDFNESIGYNIMICLDVSWSMMSEDLKPNRLAVAKDITEDFVDQRKGDKLGLIDFANDAIIRVPLTTDHVMIDEQLQKSESSTENGATAIGDALALAVDRVKDIPAESKIVILITDGTETSGYMTAETAVEIAKAFEVKVYTIGIGTQGPVRIPMPQPDGTLRTIQVDQMPLAEEVLQYVASETEGKYYNAQNEEALVHVYDEINKLEKSKIKTSQNMQTKDVFMLFVFISLIFILLEWVLRYGILRPIS